MSAQIYLAAAGGAAVLATVLTKAKTRLDLSRAKHRSIACHARMARRIASLIPFYEYDERQFFHSDDAPEDVAARRRGGFMQLSTLYRERVRKTRARTAQDGAGNSAHELISA